MSSTELARLDDESEWPEARRRTAIARHPDSEMLHALIRRGKDEKWISGWLKQQYPLEDEYGQPHPNAVEHRKWQVSAETVKKYRKEWMPEADPGVDIVSGRLQKIIGFQLPPKPGQLMELDVLEAAIAIAQHNLAKAVEQDEDMGMLQPITLEAQKALVESARTRAKMAQDLNQPGYEKAAERHIIDQQVANTNVNVNVDAEMGKDGKLKPREPEKVTLLRQLLELGPDRAKELVRVANETAATVGRTDQGQVVEAQVVEDDEAVFDADD